jgi:hypothetical protein
MFLKATALVLLIAFAGLTFYNPVLVLTYSINTSSYAKNCINKNRPKLHCNGRCQLMKKMKEREKKEQEENEKKPIAPTILFYSTILVDLLTIHTTRIKTNYQFYKKTLFPDRSAEIFHPPRC